MADNHTNIVKITISKGSEPLHAPLLQLPTIVRLPYPCPAALACVLHRLGLDVVSAIGQILPTVDCDRALRLRWGEVLETGRGPVSYTHLTLPTKA